MSLIDRNTWFWSRVDKSADCWLWTGSRTGHGYGKVHKMPDLPWSSRYAHRIAYELLVGPIPPRLVLDHLCRNPQCVNPAHLEPVTQRENIRRGTSAVAETITSLEELGMCRQGHLLESPKDWYFWRNQIGTLERCCKECQREKVRRRRARLRLEAAATREVSK